MARGYYAIRRARKAHVCTEAGRCEIAAGDFYLDMAQPPEAYRSKGWWVAKACLKHAELWQLHTAETRAQLVQAKQAAFAEKGTER